MTRSIRSRRWAAAAALVACAALAGPAAAAVTWTPVQLLGAGLAPSTALTPGGDVAIASWLPSSTGPAFSDGITLSLGTGESFTTSLISSSDLAYPDIAYGSGGTAHLGTMSQGGGGGLTYVTYASGTATETLVDTNFLLDAPSIAVDAGGQPRIAYALGTGLSLATLDAGAWTILEFWTGIGYGPRLVVDAVGANHVVWTAIDPDTGNQLGIWYATDATGSWVAGALTAGADDTQPDIAIDSLGVAHVVYARQSQHGGGVIELHPTSRGWRSKTLARGPVDSPRIGIGPGNSLNVAYWDLGQRSLGLHHVSDAAGHLVDSFVSSLGEGGAPISIAVTSDGLSYVAYTVPGICCPPTGGMFVAHN